jgi:hypothetical protein
MAQGLIRPGHRSDHREELTRSVAPVISVAKNSSQSFATENTEITERPWQLPCPVRRFVAKTNDRLAGL